MNQPKRYHPVHVTLHWLVALGVFFNLYLAIFVFSERGSGGFQLRPIHMAVGITILVLLLVRLVMRFTVKRPADATAGHKLLDIIAKIVHYGLYLTVLTVTILGVTFTSQSGMLQSAFTGSQPEFDGPSPGFDPADQNGPPGGSQSPARMFHGSFGYLLTLLVVIHILAALYHQFIRRDNLFARMWYGSR
ncbi:MAG: cytochrome b/b6 domain-containing protein [Anaerolineales bacterium]